MKKIVILFICVLSAISIYGQEDPTVTQRLKEKYDVVYDYEGGYYGVNKNLLKKGSVGLCDRNGVEIVPCIYDAVWSNQFKDYGYCTVTKDGKKGVVNKAGKLIIPCKYDDISIWYLKENKVLEVKSGDKAGAVNKEGNEILPCKFEKILVLEYGYIEATINGKVGLYNHQGKSVLPCEFDEIYSHQLKEQDYCEVEINNKFGIYHKNGKVLIPCLFESISSINQRYGYWETKMDGKRGAWNTEGKEILPSIYDDIYYDVENNHFEVKKESKRGIFDVDGKEIIPCKFEWVSKSGDYVVVTNDEKKGLYSYNERKEIFKCEYAWIGGVQEGLVPFKKVKDGKCGYMDLTGKIIIPLIYDTVSPFKDGVAQVTKDGITFLITHPIKGTTLKVNQGVKVPVDVDIPITSILNDESFAFIFANEHYNHFANADYAINDGKVLAKYCQNTLGMPENNVRYYEDATFGNMANALKQIKDIAEVYDGEAKIIFYFSGFGITDEKSKNRFILPTDASLSALASTAYSVSELMTTLNELKTQYTLMIIDAPFDGRDKGGKKLSSDRGVALVKKTIVPQESVIGLIGSEQGNGYSCKQLQHGLLTYTILEKLKSTKGNCSLSELLNASRNRTKEESLKNIKELQTPLKVVSDKIDPILTNKKL